jgi:type II secretory ATPase GspE/PulE/Tfp pilus assembly ATPase PilB-like protein
LLAVLSQRLARRLCEACSVVDPDECSRLGLAVDRPRRAVGCAECRSTGYSGRLLLAELLLPEAHGVGPAILERVDSRELERRAVEHGLITLEERAASACRAGWTDPREVRRILGYGRNPLDDLCHLS